MNVYAYARVSARDQNLDRQIEAFTAFGVEKSRIFCDKKSGRDFDRSGYKRMFARLRRGDLLVIKSIDRLGRNYEMIIEEWRAITEKKGADILVLDMPVLDTRSKDGDLVDRFISDVVLQVLSFVAENERENMRARQAEGIRCAKARGVRFGRPRRVYSAEVVAAAEDYIAKKITLREALERADMKKGKFYYHIRCLKGGKK